MLTELVLSFCLCTPVGPYKQAERLDPPEPIWPVGLYNQPFAPFGLTDCQEMMFYAKQFGLPNQFEGIGWRESNCRNEIGVHTSCCYGYWQLHKMHFYPNSIMDRVCGADSIQDVAYDDPISKQKQACSAKQLYDQVGTSAWISTR